MLTVTNVTNVNDTKPLYVSRLLTSPHSHHYWMIKREKCEIDNIYRCKIAVKGGGNDETLRKRIAEWLETWRLEDRTSAGVMSSSPHFSHLLYGRALPPPGGSLLCQVGLKPKLLRVQTLVL